MSAETKPHVLSSKEIFHGKVFDVTLDTVMEGDITYNREVVHHPGSAVIIPIFDDGTVALVRQYRHPAVRYLLEIPAGTLDGNESPEEGAARELKEELGYTAGCLEKLSEFFVTPGFCEEKMWLYLATDLQQSEQQLEPDELIEIVRVPLSQALEMITDGEIEDAKTILGLLLAAPRFPKETCGEEYPAV